MWRRTFEQLSKPFRRFAKENRGSVAIYGGLVTALALGGGVLAIDLGKMEAIRNEMQNAADSAALSAALQLSGQAGARYNAEGVAIEAIDDYSRLVDDDNMAKFTTTSICARTSKKLTRRSNGGGTQTQKLCSRGLSIGVWKRLCLNALECLHSHCGIVKIERCNLPAIGWVKNRSIMAGRAIRFYLALS